ncbi:MAG: oligonucleotide/oligosaccharide-binding fold domain-containing protein, partial [Pirellula sp.]
MDAHASFAALFQELPVDVSPFSQSNMELLLWPGSSLRGANAKWIVCSEVVETHDRFARTAARIDPVWIEKVLGHCLKYSYDEPHFSRKQGSAMVMRRG